MYLLYGSCDSFINMHGYTMYHTYNHLTKAVVSGISSWSAYSLVPRPSARLPILYNILRVLGTRLGCIDKVDVRERGSHSNNKPDYFNCITTFKAL